MKNKLILTILTYLFCSSLNLVIAQSESLKQDFQSTIMYGDKSAISRLNSTIITMCENQDTIALRKFVNFLKEEQYNLEYKSPTQRIIFDGLLGQLSVALGDFHYAIENLERCYQVACKSKKVESDNMISISSSLCISYIAIEDYEEAYKYAKEMLHISKRDNNISMMPFIHSRLATCACGLKDYETAYKYINLANNGDIICDLSHNSTHIETLMGLICTLVENKSYGSIPKYYNEMLGIINSYPEQHLSLYFTDDFIINYISYLHKSCRNEDEIFETISFLLSSRMKDSSEVLNSKESSLQESVANLALHLALLSSQSKFNIQAKLFSRFALSIVEDFPISHPTLIRATNFYAKFIVSNEKNFVEAFDLYNELLFKSIELNDTVYCKNLVNSILSYYSVATFFIRYLHKHEDIDSGCYVLPINDVRKIISKWSDVYSKLSTFLGDDVVLELLHSYFDLPENKRVFSFFSPADTELLLLHTYIYESNYAKFDSQLDILCKEYSCTEKQVKDILSRIDNALVRFNTKQAVKLYRSHVVPSINASVADILNGSRKLSKYIKNTVNNSDTNSLSDSTSVNDDPLIDLIDSALYYEEAGDYKKSISAWNLFLKEVEQREGRNCENYYMGLVSKGRVLVVAENYREAEKILVAAQAPTGKIDIRIVLQHNLNLGKCALKLGKIDESYDKYKFSYDYLLKNRNFFVEESGDDYHWCWADELCRITIEIAHILKLKGEYLKAEKVILNAIDKISSCSNASKNELIYYELIDIYNKILSNCVNINDEEHALSTYDAAIQIASIHSYTISVIEWDNVRFIIGSLIKNDKNKAIEYVAKYIILFHQCIDSWYNEGMYESTQEYLLSKQFVYTQFGHHFLEWNEFDLAEEYFRRAKIFLEENNLKKTEDYLNVLEDISNVLELRHKSN